MDCEIAFKQLNYALVHAPVLSIPDFDAIFMVKTNASDTAVGASWLPSYLNVKSAQVCAMQLQYYGSQTLINCVYKQKMALFSGWEKRLN